ncbi:MAG TPA: Na+/H+ antiporter NhaA [Actinobacteria bacterium]|nr:Na+/H+ antiporter NhaA [Actinomycetota bacterium]
MPLTRAPKAPTTPVAILEEIVHTEERIHRTWLHSDRYVPRRFVRPALAFMETESAGGIVLLAAALLAILWANSPWWHGYFSLWETHLTIELGGWFHFSHSLKDIVNDGLMAIFFFVVGLEIKRELVVGELNEPKKAALPAMAALGGMIVPALIYVAFVGSNGGGDAMAGWGIPMATDIAFSVGILALLGSRISLGAKLFLLALAIVDDLGAIAVIAIFYTESLEFGWLLAAAAGLVVTAVAARVGIRSLLFYGVIAVGVWFAVLESGVHATIAGVALGLLTPVHALYSDEEFRRKARWILERFEMSAAAPDARSRLDSDALQLAAVATESVPPLRRLEHRLHGWSSFAIVPIFALANAGVRFVGLDLGEVATSPVTLGVAVGLMVGKPVGIATATWLAVRSGLGELPRRTDFRRVVGLGFIAGIGFTVSLFITELAFRGSEIGELLGDEAKIGIFAGSIVAGVVGYLLLRSAKTVEEELDAAREAVGAPVPTP